MNQERILDRSITDLSLQREMTVCMQCCIFIMD